MIKRWVSAELTNAGEAEANLSLVIKEVKRILPGAEVFIPAHSHLVDGTWIKTPFLEGYLFVRGLKKETDYFKLANTVFVKGILVVPGLHGGDNQISYVDDSVIKKYRKQLDSMSSKAFEKGKEVEVVSGLYRGLRGTVIESLPKDQVLIEIKLKSLTSLKEFPRLFLKRVN